MCISWLEELKTNISLIPIFKKGEGGASIKILFCLERGVVLSTNIEKIIMEWCH